MTIRKPRRKNNRQLWILLALLVAVIAVIALLPSGDGAAAPDRNPDSEIEAATLVKAGDQAPDFTVEMFDGSRVTLADLRGKVVLLNFWATWCPPCREELTHVQTELIDRFAGRPFVFLPVSRGESRETVAAFREKTGYEFPMGLDSTQSVYKRYAANYIPRNFLIDADGRVVSATVGFEKSEFEELIRSVEAALGEDTPCEK
ncbi:TlpA family protein disulfide reductase [Alistipes sp. An66]|uniref:TlpA family protein disulfide reductase n=1 Tax=Alistipes sp. An66 TaxID=1965650 RepID=UPI000B392B56|nr:redoxin domain-containing protein [Alistipes sp. An66]OUN58158.1 peroxiredoxin [Alistipes sp. An66]